MSRSSDLLARHGWERDEATYNSPILTTFMSGEGFQNKGQLDVHEMSIDVTRGCLAATSTGDVLEVLRGIVRRVSSHRDWAMGYVTDELLRRRQRRIIGKGKAGYQSIKRNHETIFLHHIGRIRSIVRDVESSGERISAELVVTVVLLAERLFKTYSRLG